MSEIRTIEKAVEELKAVDPQTAITAWALRRLVVSGEIPSRKTGKKYLLNMDDVKRYFCFDSGDE